MTKTSKPKLINLHGKRWWLFVEKEGLTVHHQIYFEGKFVRKDKHTIPWELIEELKEKYN